MEPSLITVKAIIILDNNGKRIVSKYYDDTFPSIKEQKQWETKLFSKTQKANSEIIILDQLTAVYRCNVDLFFYVVGSSTENELILNHVLSTLFDSVNFILRKNVEKRELLDNLDQIFLIIDEICDQGIILDSNPRSIVERCLIRGDEIPLSEQTLGQVLKNAKEQIQWSLLKS